MTDLTPDDRKRPAHTERQQRIRVIPAVHQPNSALPASGPGPWRTGIASRPRRSPSVLAPRLRRRAGNHPHKLEALRLTNKPKQPNFQCPGDLSRLDAAVPYDQSSSSPTRCSSCWLRKYPHIREASRMDVQLRAQEPECASFCLRRILPFRPFASGPFAAGTRIKESP